MTDVQSNKDKKRPLYTHKHGHVQRHKLCTMLKFTSSSSAFPTKIHLKWDILTHTQKHTHTHTHTHRHTHIHSLSLSFFLSLSLSPLPPHSPSPSSPIPPNYAGATKPKQPAKQSQTRRTTKAEQKKILIHTKQHQQHIPNLPKLGVGVKTWPSSGWVDWLLGTLTGLEEKWFETTDAAKGCSPPLLTAAEQ